jgi:SAM-dependent methyltransferase
MGEVWHVVAVGDFNQEGRSDIVWRQDGTGTVALGDERRQPVVLRRECRPDVVGLEDRRSRSFQRRGRQYDVVWVDTSNHVQIWQMANGRVANVVNPNRMDGINWHLEAVGNFAGDANSDLLLDQRRRRRRPVGAGLQLARSHWTVKGKVCGVVIPEGKSSGWIVPDAYRARFEVWSGDAKAPLPKMADEIDSIDLIHHDSDHTYDHMMFEFREAKRKLKPDGLVVGDDVSWNASVWDFADEHALLQPQRRGRSGVLLSSA